MTDDKIQNCSRPRWHGLRRGVCAIADTQGVAVEQAQQLLERVGNSREALDKTAAEVKG